MPQFRKKPVVIEAVQWTGQNWADICDFMPVPTVGRGEEHPSDEHMDIVISTLEGDMTANLGDWIIRGVNGEFYPCKADIFEKTYEPIEV